MTWIYNIILLLGREGVGILPEPVPDATIVGYIYNTTREPTSTMHLERVPSGTRSTRNMFHPEHVPAVPRERVPSGTRSTRNPFPPEPVPGGVPEHVPPGTRSRRAPVPAVPREPVPGASREPVPGEHAPAAADSGGTKAGGAGGTVVRTRGYLSFSRRGVRRGFARVSLRRKV